MSCVNAWVRMEAAGCGRQGRLRGTPATPLRERPSLLLGSGRKLIFTFPRSSWFLAALWAQARTHQQGDKANRGCAVRAFEIIKKIILKFE